jgi:hypothetical protein
MKTISPGLAWLRKFLAAVFGGAADGLLIGLGGAGAISVASKQPVDVHAIGYMVVVNILLDTARFVKSNPDPWEFPVPASMPVVIPPTAPEAPKAL